MNVKGWRQKRITGLKVSFMGFMCLNTDCTRGERKTDSVTHRVSEDLSLIHLPLGKMAAIFKVDIVKCIFVYEKFFIWLKFHWSLFPRVHLTITQHWIRQWLGADSAISHYLNQCWLDWLTHTWGTRGRWVNVDVFCGDTVLSDFIVVVFCLWKWTDNSQ